MEQEKIWNMERQLSITLFEQKSSRVTTFEDDETRALTGVMSPDASMIAIIYRINGDPTEQLGLSAVAVKTRDGRVVARLGRGVLPVWSPDSSRLIVRRSAFASELFQIDSEMQLTSVRADLPGTCPEWNPSSTVVLMSSQPSIYRMFDRSGRPVGLPIMRPLTTTVAGWSPDGLYVLLNEMYGRVFSVHNHAGGQAIAIASFEGRPNIVKWAYDSSHLVVLSDAQVSIRDIRDDTEVRLDTCSTPYALDWSPDATRLAVSYRDSVEILRGEEKNGKLTWNRIATVPNLLFNMPIDASAIFTLPPRPEWTSDSSKLAVFSAEPSSISVFTRDGRPLSVIAMHYNAFHPSLSSNFTHLLSMIGEQLSVTCLAKWTYRTNHMFNKQFRRTVFVMMMVWHTLDADSNQPTSSLRLPRVPMELWLMVLGFLHC